YGDMIAILYNETPKHKENFIKLAKEHYFDSLLFHRVIKDFMIQGGDPDSKKAAPGQPLGQGGPGYTIEKEFNTKFFHQKGALAAARLGDQQNPTQASSGSQFYIVQGRALTEEDLNIDSQKFGQAAQQFMTNPANQAARDSAMQFYQTGDQDGYRKYMIQLKPRIEKFTGINTKREVDPAKLKAYTTNGGFPDLDGQYTVFGQVIKGFDVIDKIAAQPGNPMNRPLEDIRMKVSVKEMSRKKIEKEYGYKFPN
ncbi:MAG TPA: peptidylprolyl isomerase, partial [Ohtaekwangia sp.]